MKSDDPTLHARPTICAGAVALALMISVPAAAQDTDTAASIYVGAIYSDNIDRQPSDGIEETIAEVGGSLGIERESSNLVVSLAADGSYRHYTDDTFDDEFVGGVDFNGTYRFIPNRFEWFLSDSFGQAQTDIRAQQTPDNRGNFNRLSTGPRFTLPIGGVNYITLSGTYTDLYFEERPDGYEEIAGQLGLLRSVTENRSVGLLASASDIEYDDSPNRDAEIRSAYLRLSSQGRRSTLDIDIGYNELETPVSEGDGPLLRATFERTMSPRATLTLSARNSFAPTGDAIGVTRLFELVELPETLRPNDFNQPAELTSFSATIGYDAERTRFSLGGWYSNEESVTLGVANERERSGLRASVTRDVSEYISLGLSGSFGRDDFVGDDESLDRINYGANLRWKLGRRTNLVLSVTRFEGDGGTTRPDFDYEETEARLRLVYVPRRGQ